jgi:hypothetical protein
MILFNTCIHTNYIYLVVWYYLIDMGSIYPTSLELVTYFLIFLCQTYVLASIKILDKFIAEVIDAQISFSSTINLSKDLMFKTRIHKVIAFQNILDFISLVTTGLIIFALWDGDESGKLPWTHLIFLTYPPLTNLFLVIIQRKNFQSKLFESKVFAVDSGSRIQKHKIPNFYESMAFVINKDILKKDMVLLEKNAQE